MLFAKLENVNKLWNNNHSVHENERNRNKKQIQVTSHSNWPRVLLFHLAHKQCNGIIKGWLHCLNSEPKGRFLVSNTSDNISFLPYLPSSKGTSYVYHPLVEIENRKTCGFIQNTDSCQVLITRITLWASKVRLNETKKKPGKNFTRTAYWQDIHTKNSRRKSSPDLITLGYMEMLLRN